MAGASSALATGPAGVDGVASTGALSAGVKSIRVVAHLIPAGVFYATASGFLNFTGIIR